MSTDSNRVLLKHHLKKLRLPTMGREWEAVAASCAKEGRDYGDFLLGLTERELIEREQRAAQRRIKGAKFPVLKTLDSFDFGAQPSINETLVRQLVSGEYLEARENVLLIGNSGTGKTHLATSLGFAACTQGKRVRFWSATALVTHMLELRDQRDLKRFFAQVEKHDLLVLDELGYVHRGQRRELPAQGRPQAPQEAPKGLSAPPPGGLVALRAPHPPACGLHPPNPHN